MNLTLHLVRKDLRRLRLALILWSLFLCGQVGAAQWLIAYPAPSPDWFTISSMLFNLLLALGMLATYFLTAALVLEDPVRGTGMFWATRPIANGRLLGAKLMVAALAFVVLPLLVWGAWWLFSRYAFDGIASGALRVLGLQLAAVIPAFAVATLSSNLARLLVATFVLFLALLAGALNFIGRSGGEAGVNIARVLLTLGVLGGTAVVITLWMYLTRATKQALLLAAGGLVLAVLVAWRWPYAWPGWQQTTRFELADAAKISLSVESARLDAVKNRDGYDDQFLILKIRVLGLPRQLGLRQGGRADVTLEWADGTMVSQPRLWLGRGADDQVALYEALGIAFPSDGRAREDDPETVAKLAELREKGDADAAAKGRTRFRRIHNPDDPRSVWATCRVPVSATLAERIRREPPACRLAVRVETGRPEIVGELPLEPGETATKRGRVELLVFGEYTRPAPSSFPWGANGMVSVLQEPGDDSSFQFVLVNRKKGTTGYVNSNVLLPVAPVVGKIWWAPIDINVPPVWRTDRWVATPGWRENWRLGVVANRPTGGFDRQVRSEQLRLATFEEMEEMERIPPGMPL